MITVMKESSGPMLAVTATGTVTGEDYTEVWIPALQKVISDYGKCRALLYMDENFKGWDLKAMWEDTKFGIKHRNDFARIAVVGGPDWVRWGVKLGELMMDCEIKTYEPSQLKEALSWAAQTPKCACDD